METGGTKGGVKRKSARVAEQEAEKKRKIRCRAKVSNNRALGVRP